MTDKQREENKENGSQEAKRRKHFNKERMRAGEVAQQQSTCLPCSKPQSLDLDETALLSQIIITTGTANTFTAFAILAVYQALLSLLHRQGN